MQRTHPYAATGKCPCAIGADAVRAAAALFAASGSVEAFARAMEEARVIGRRIWYDAARHAICIEKRYACEDGPTGAGEGIVAERCHCDFYRSMPTPRPMADCQCGAEFYRPMFAPLFGGDVRIAPVATVLAGDAACVLAVFPDKEVHP